MTKQELAAKIWRMANKMRTKIKANEYKDYILGFMFYKYLSDKELARLRDDGITDEELQNLTEDDKDYIRNQLGYVIAYEDLFSTWKANGNATAKSVTESLDRFNKNIHPKQAHVFHDIFNTLWNGIGKMGDSSGSRDKAVRDMIDMIDMIPTDNTNDYDALAYIYEFFIYKFATAAKDDGAFYTPHEVSRLISLIVADRCKEKTSLRVYDPTSGSGSLLRCIGEAAERYIPKMDISYYGQEKITETFHLTRMNLIMKDVAAQNIIVRNGDTLEDDWPYFDETTAYKALRVDAVVSNPPYSLNWEPESRINDDRFKKYGLAPSSKADYAFLLHCLYHMESDGIMAIVLPHGVLFRGDSEAEIRKNLCKEHNIETIIGLPANLFFATSIPTIIMILSKNRKSDDILFIDASKQFEKGKNNNVLRECDIKRIFDAVTARKDIKGYARLVPMSEIERNDYNLNIPRYVDSSDNSEKYDLAATMLGTLPDSELDDYAAYWNLMPSLKASLFTQADDADYSILYANDIAGTVKTNPDVLSFHADFEKRVNDYCYQLETELLKIPAKNNDLTEQVCDKAMQMVSDLPVLDPYDIYQTVIMAWSDINTDLEKMKGDKHVAVQTEPNYIMKKIGKEEEEVQQGYKGTIFPFSLIGSTFFHAEYTKLDQTKSRISANESTIADAYDGLDDDVKAAVGDGEKFREAEIKKYLKTDIDDTVRDTLNEVLNAFADNRQMKKKIKNTETELLACIKEKIETLTDDEIDMLLKEKWITPIRDGLLAQAEQSLNTLIKGITVITDKYCETLSDIQTDMNLTSGNLSDMLEKLRGSDVDKKAVSVFQNNLANK